MGFSVCSYNMGTNIADFRQLYQKARAGEPIPDDLPQQYAEAEKAASESLKECADVYCLQESRPGDWNLKWQDRPLFLALQERGFEFYCGKFETVIIALDPKRFRVISHNAEEQRQRVMVVAEDLVTKKTVAFVSTWVPGFSLVKSYAVNKEEERRQEPGSPYEANQMANGIVEELEKNEDKPDMEIVAGDMNATPERWHDLFDIFKERDFKVYRTNQPTQINTNEWEKAYPERELDYAFVKKPSGLMERIAQFFRSIFSMDPYYEEWETIGIPAAFEGWNEKTNGSDHKPIVLTVHRELAYSYLFRLGEWLGCFSASKE